MTSSSRCCFADRLTSKAVDSRFASFYTPGFRFSCLPLSDERLWTGCWSAGDGPIRVAKKRIAKKSTARRAGSSAKAKQAGAAKSGKKKAKAAAQKAVRKRATAARSNPTAKSVTNRAVKKVKARVAKHAKSKKTVKKQHSRQAQPSEKPPATALDPIQFPEEPVPMPKTYLTSKELKEFKELVLAKRRELAGDVSHLTDEVTHRGSQGDGQRSSMPIHMADIGSDNWEHEFTIGLIANERELLHELDGALARIENKTYGICRATHKRITKARLRAKPWAKYCIDYARTRDEGGAP